ncbi:hypothetical protein [Salinithrix halophila]|uniref:Uncharacterized protein n=1 Tax=Salinithrix halophila TaxID=1485204 RepID=A0ABV8JFJ6_9BACL
MWMNTLILVLLLAGTGLLTAGNKLGAVINLVAVVMAIFVLKKRGKLKQ